LVTIFAEEQLLIFSAKNGEEGLVSALENHPDIILLDIVMPVMDGMTMLRHIRTNGGAWGKDVKVVVYTNLSYNEMRDQAKHVGVADFLIKANVPLSEITKRVREELALAPAR